MSQGVGHLAADEPQLLDCRLQMEDFRLRRARLWLLGNLQSEICHLQSRQQRTARRQLGQGRGGAEGVGHAEQRRLALAR